jgi:hypothetical protein
MTNTTTKTAYDLQPGDVILLIGVPINVTAVKRFIDVNKKPMVVLTFEGGTSHLENGNKEYQVVEAE